MADERGRSTGPGDDARHFGPDHSQPLTEPMPVPFTYVLEAHVREGVSVLHWPKEESTWEDYSCRVIECRGGETEPIALTIWIRIGDGAVLQHEARLWDDTWIFVRRPINFRPPKPKPKLP